MSCRCKLDERDDYSRRWHRFRFSGHHSAAILGFDVGQVNECELFQRFAPLAGGVRLPLLNGGIDAPVFSKSPGAK
jgi:hypothetical protein